MGDTGIRKNMQRVILHYLPTGTVSSVDMNLIYDYDDVTAPQPSAYDLRNSAGFGVYGDSTYGIAAYGSRLVTPLYRQTVEGSGFTVALRFSDDSTNPTYRIQGFALEFTPGVRM